MAKRKVRLTQPDIPPPKKETKQEILRRWKRVPLLKDKPKECNYCGRNFITPCDKDEYELCENYRKLDKSARRVRLKKGKR